MAADSPIPSTLAILISPSPSSSLNLSLAHVLGLVALVSIPIIIYLFLFAIRHPSDTTTTTRASSSSPVLSISLSGNRIKSDFTGGGGKVLSNDTEFFQEEAEQGESDDHDCAVCLSGFDGTEDAKQLSVCKHTFHASCIDAWLDSNGNTCPVCRASIGHKKRVHEYPLQDSSDMV